MKTHTPQQINLYRDTGKRHYLGFADITIYNEKSVQYVFGDKVVDRSRQSFDEMVEFGHVTIEK